MILFFLLFFVASDIISLFTSIHKNVNINIYWAFKCLVIIFVWFVGCWLSPVSVWVISVFYWIILFFSSFLHSVGYNFLIYFHTQKCKYKQIWGFIMFGCYHFRGVRRLLVVVRFGLVNCRVLWDNFVVFGIRLLGFSYYPINLFSYGWSEL